MKKTLKTLLGTAIALAAVNSKPCNAIPFYGIPPPEPNVVAAQEETYRFTRLQKYSIAMSAAAIAISSLAIGIKVYKDKKSL